MSYQYSEMCLEVESLQFMPCDSPFVVVINKKSDLDKTSGKNCVRYAMNLQFYVYKKK